MPVFAATHHYTITLSEDLSSLEVEARLTGGVTRISTRSRDADDILIAMRECDSGRSITVNSRAISLRDGLDCLSYSVDLRGFSARRGSSEQAIVAPITQWMWRPRLGGADEIIVTFSLPENAGVSVPWQPLDGGGDRYRLTSSPQSGTGLAIFGLIDEVTVPVANTGLRIVPLPSADNPIGQDTIEWTRQTAEHIALTYGRFPNPHARVILFPVQGWRANSAVPFGRVVRDGGETIELMVNPQQPEDVFLGDWTATHEFSHLMLPYLAREQRWISEGFAQYYQNVLLARAGQYTHEDAWQKIRAGLERGRESSPSLSPNEAASGDERNSRMKIYWSGAALALMADVELRRRSDGAESLDLVLDRFQSCCLPSRRTWSGRELFARFDALVDEPLFVALYERYADTRDFPAFEALLEEPEFAEIRAAITARRYTDEPGR
jgi:hypothetical protein